MRERSDREPVYQITGARRSLTEDVDSRQRRYLMSMGVRTVCFFLAIVSSGPLRFVFIVAAVLLPYISVVFANSGRERIMATPLEHVPPPRAGLDGGGERPGAS